VRNLRSKKTLDLSPYQYIQYSEKTGSGVFLEVSLNSYFTTTSFSGANDTADHKIGVFIVEYLGNFEPTVYSKGFNPWLRGLDGAV
jgi:hypothetical protein